MKDLDLEDLFLRERQIQSRSALIEHRVDIALNFSSFHLALIENLSNQRKKKKKKKRKMKKVSIAEGSLYTRRTGVNFSPTWA